VIGSSVQLSEAEPHWRKFLESLQKRGMHGVKLVVSDDHTGLRAARQAVMAGVPWQRCQFHTIRNAMAHAPSRLWINSLLDRRDAIAGAQLP
jgi:transposase-like protein